MLAPGGRRNQVQGEILADLHRQLEIDAQKLGGLVEHLPLDRIEAAERLNVNHPSLAVDADRLAVEVLSVGLARFLVFRQPIVRQGRSELGVQGQEPLSNAAGNPAGSASSAGARDTVATTTATTPTSVAGNTEAVMAWASCSG